MADEWMKEHIEQSQAMSTRVSSTTPPVMPVNINYALISLTVHSQIVNRCPQRGDKMRLGWLAAVAASMCASQVQAARYYEFELVGSANTAVIPITTGFPNYTYTGDRAFNYNDTLRFAFDTGGSAQGSDYSFASGSGFAIVSQGTSSGSHASLGTLTQPAGPLFGFSFLLSDVAFGDTLQNLALSNTGFGYRVRPDGRYSYTFDTISGQILSVAARTSDIAPTSFGVTERLIVSAVPEPVSWAMMIIGFGAVGGAMRRRNVTARVAFTAA